MAEQRPLFGTEFIRQVDVHPAHDCIAHPCGKRGCGTNPGSSHGIGSCKISFYLIAGDRSAAVQFVVGTGWYLTDTTQRLLADPKNHPTQFSPGSEWFSIMTPRAWDLGYHSPFPMYESHTPMQNGACHLIGRTCYYDGSSLNAEAPWEILLNHGTGGEDGLWAYLETYFHETFSEERRLGFAEMLGMLSSALEDDDDA